MKYTCENSRKEMNLVALRKRLQEEDLDEEEKSGIGKEIRKLEEEMEIS